MLTKVNHVNWFFSRQYYATYTPIKMLKNKREYKYGKITLKQVQPFKNGSFSQCKYTYSIIEKKPQKS